MCGKEGRGRAARRRPTLRPWVNQSSAVATLFLEHVPFVLRDWLTEQLAAGPAQAEAAVKLVDHQLLDAVSHLRSAGISHTDTVGVRAHQRQHVHRDGLTVEASLVAVVAG